MRSRHAIPVLLALAALAGLFGCKSEQAQQQPATNSTQPTKAATKPAAGGVTLGFLVKQPEEQWFQEEWKYAQEYADKNGINLVKIGVPDGQKVLDAIDNLNSQGAKGFVICTPDVNLGASIMAKAKQYNMKVISVDDQFLAGGKPMTDVPYMGINAREIGRSVGRELYKQFKARGWNTADTAVCAVTYEQLPTAKERTDGSTEALVAAGFPKDKIYKAEEKTTDIPGAIDAANTILTQHPEVKHWLAFSMNDEGVLGAVRAMEGRNFDAKAILAIGIGAGSGITELKKPQVTGFYGTYLINPYRHGYETTEMLYKWVTQGVEPPKNTLTEGEIVTRQTWQDAVKRHGLTIK